MDRRWTCRIAGLLLVAAPAVAQKKSDMTGLLSARPGDTLLIGFLGARERWHDGRRAVVQLAQRLSDRRIEGVHTQAVENRRRPFVRDLILKNLDHDHDGMLSKPERSGARIILYGQSFGGAAVVKLARELEAAGVPVLLTVQVDSVGRGDQLIPANVRAAANFYQHDRWTIRGEDQIRAADPRRTSILGNFRSSYRDSNAGFGDEPWRILGGSHAKMERDPELWSRIERLMLDAIEGR